MKRYLRTLGLFISTSLAAEMEYRVNFAIASLVGLGQVAGAVFTLYLLCQDGYAPGGWDFNQGMLVIGCFTIMSGLISTILETNLSYLVRHVRNGTLDFILLKPIDPQFWLSTRRFSPWGIPNLIYGWALIFIGAYRSDADLAMLALGIIPVFFGMLTLYSLWFILATSSILFVKVTNITFVLSGLLDAGRFPVKAYPDLYRIFFTFVIPVAFLTTVPSQVILGEDVTYLIFITGLVSIGTLALSRAWWKFVQRYYTSASS